MTHLMPVKFLMTDIAKDSRIKLKVNVGWNFKHIDAKSTTKLISFF